MPKSSAAIRPITGIGNVADAPHKQENTITINNVQITEVPVLDIYKACLQCKAHVDTTLRNAQGKTVII
jgi:hypothetical protein